jgi:hypothetical protein
MKNLTNISKISTVSTLGGYEGYEYGYDYDRGIVEAFMSRKDI